MLKMLEIVAIVPANFAIGEKKKNNSTRKRKVLPSKRTLLWNRVVKPA